MMIRHRKSGLSAPFRAMALVGLSSLAGCTTVMSPFTAPAMSLPAAFRSTDTTGVSATTSAGSPALRRRLLLERLSLRQRLKNNLII